ncbi:unnamed protein product (macronuclear) [Paramecium tetraurelia]|uniref:Uncharacterized protein n=1 Tax=Paramecium tetraurelia TaxID=5888 RepID=A0D959_PARTE|nr:uncharacterized protein GSPATT00014522001 [Paramecium tetraurelia]CAK79576.1 unnamed protein product [Paramecium tetraurelia]|eukprot:XP_001446973.1 hypothetical protein (macronuclear) [Paramecium tetraurelia strain d4-2]
MEWFEYLFDAKILIGFGVGLLTASLSLFPTLREHNQENAQSKMKLSNKSIPSTQDLKQVYIKNDPQSKDKKKSNQNTNLTETNKQDLYFNLDDGVRKKIKVQKTDEEQSSQDHQSSLSIKQDEESQSSLPLNNINNQNESNQGLKEKSEVPQPPGQQGGHQTKKIASEPSDKEKQDSGIQVEQGREQEKEDN